jgi:hypothetical protein
MNVNANDKTIEAVLSGGFYQVPRFQRPYSWDASNVEDFWEDVAESGADYFIGSMVIFNGGGASGLVDGQQRLTTATMMLSAIRNEYVRLGDSDAAAGIQTLIERKDSKGKRRFVLHTESSYPYLQAAIQSEPGSAPKVPAVRTEERDLQRAFTLITEWTRSISDSAFENKAVSEAKRKQQAIQDLGDHRDKIYGLTVVLVEVDDEDDATTIFQTLNSRGKDLETADLVKAHLLQMLKAPNAQLDQARDTWDAMRDSFDESAATISANRFLLHTWLSREEYVGEKDLFKRIKKRIRANNAQGYLDDLRVDAERYRTAQEPSFRSWAKPQRPVARSLSAMNLFRLQQHLPFVLSVLREYDAKTIKLAVLMRALTGVENFHFLATAVTNQPSSGGISRMYAAAARSVLRGSTPGDKAAAIDDLLQKLRTRKPTYAEFEAAFVELRSSRAHTQQTTLVRYVLNKLHVAVPASTDTAPIDLDQLTVEHLVPQGAKRPASVVADDAARIGNLLLFTENLNAALADKPFTEKKRALKNVPGVEPEILAAGSWGATEILNRSKRLARRAYDEVWTL